MARRYVRDNRGRFASTGATARGGRLKTASGKKRETQTMKTSGGGVSGTIGKPKGLKSGAIKPKPQVSSARQAASDRLKIKTATIRKLKNDRASVIPEQSAGSKTMKAGRVGSTVSKPRTKGNAPAQVASRVKRKNAANEAGLRQMTRYGNSPNPSTYNRAIKRANTLKRADAYLKTGNLPGKNNSIKAQRELKAARQRLDAKRAARQRGDTAAANKAQVSARGKVRKPAQNFKPAVPGKSAPDNARTRANKLRTAQNKVRMYSETTSRSAQNAISRRDAALRARPQGTPGNVIFRSKGRAANRFQQRASDLTQRVKSDLASGKGKGIYSATGGGGGSGLRRRDTGDRQTSMFGKPAPLYKTSKVSSVRRRRR